MPDRREEIAARRQALAEALIKDVEGIRDSLDSQPPPQNRKFVDDCCGAEPPTDGTWGDCWCTLPPDHDGEHQCQPCTDRHGAPGWTDPQTNGDR